MSFDAAIQVANAVLYEGYALYPYRASAAKNQMRWQFGVVAPRGFSESTGLDPWYMRSECLLEPRRSTSLHVKLRFLQLERRTPAADGGDVHAGAWDGGIEREFDVVIPWRLVLEGEQTFPVYQSAHERSEIEANGRSIRLQSWDIEATVRLEGETLDAPSPLIRLRVTVENNKAWGDATSERQEAVRYSLLGLHILLWAPDGEWVSLTDPPEWAKHHAKACTNLHTWPVLAGEAPRRDLMLSSPIILYDYPQVAPESAGDLFDATEIDEILSLRTMTLTDEEKAEARATDPRVAALLDQVEGLPPEMLDRLHGSIRYLRSVESEEEPRGSDDPSIEPEATGGSSSAVEATIVGGVRVERGSRVRVRGDLRQTDAQDLFLEGREGQVEKVMQDAEGRIYLALSLCDDPAAELNSWHGRFLYFEPHEVDVVETKV